MSRGWSRYYLSKSKPLARFGIDPDSLGFQALCQGSDGGLQKRCVPTPWKRPPFPPWATNTPLSVTAQLLPTKHAQAPIRMDHARMS